MNEVVPIAFGALADAISAGLGNDVFMPDAFKMYIPHKDYDFNESNLFPGYYAEKPPEWVWTSLLSNHINTGKEHYEFVYYWKLQRQVYSIRNYPGKKIKIKLPSLDKSQLVVSKVGRVMSSITRNFTG